MPHEKKNTRLYHPSFSPPAQKQVNILITPDLGTKKPHSGNLQKVGSGGGRKVCGITLEELSHSDCIWEETVPLGLLWFSIYSEEVSRVSDGFAYVLACP